MKTDQSDFTQPDDRRRALRLKLNLPMESQGSPGRILNISKTGLRYLTPSAVSPGSRLDLSLQFQNGTVQCKADAVWVHRLGVSSVVGVRFAEEEESSQRVAEQLDGIIASTQAFFEKSLARA